jgi:hypothetical protein
MVGLRHLRTSGASILHTYQHQRIALEGTAMAGLLRCDYNGSLDIQKDITKDIISQKESFSPVWRQRILRLLLKYTKADHNDTTVYIVHWMSHQ